MRNLATRVRGASRSMRRKITQLKNGTGRSEWSDHKSSLRATRPRPAMQVCARENLAGTSFSVSGPKLAEVASAGGSGDEPALCQTPATTLTNRSSDRESVAARTPIPSKRSRPSVESGGVVPRNAVSNWLRGTESSAFGAGCRNRRSEAASGPDPRDAPNNHRNSLGTFARRQTKNRARSQRVRIGWCGAESRSGRATSLGRIASRFTIRETEIPENSGSLQVEDDRWLGWFLSGFQQKGALIGEGEAPAEPVRRARVIHTPARQEPRPPEQRRGFQWESDLSAAACRIPETQTLRSRRPERLRRD